MTVAMLRGPTRTTPRPAPRRAPRPATEALCEPTLDQLITKLWADVTSHVTTTCPVCDGAMRPRYGAGAGSVGGRCADCGTSIG